MKTRTYTQQDVDEIIQECKDQSDGIQNYYDEQTLFKVRNALLDARCVTDEDDASSIINALQNAGILFRERA